MHIPNSLILVSKKPKQTGKKHLEHLADCVDRLVEATMAKTEKCEEHTRLASLVGCLMDGVAAKISKIQDLFKAIFNNSAFFL